jgi:dUTP pyrophosphatase
VRTPDPGPGAPVVPVVPLVLDADDLAPAYSHPGDAGADLRCSHDVTLGPGRRATVGTGVRIALPEGYAGFVHPRSGLAARHGVTVLNAPGTVDAGYRGELRVTLLNTDLDEPVTFRRGDRIAQLVVQRVERVSFVPVPELDQTVRGAAGFGSTGGFPASGGVTEPAAGDARRGPAAD